MPRPRRCAMQHIPDFRSVQEDQYDPAGAISTADAGVVRFSALAARQTKKSPAAPGFCAVQQRAWAQSTFTMAAATASMFLSFSAATHIRPESTP